MSGKRSWKAELTRLRRRADLATLRAALWAWRAFRSADRQLDASGGFGTVVLPELPELPADAERGVKFVLARNPDRCFVHAHVRQVWHAAHGDRRDIVIGVVNEPRFRAHAWLDGDPPEEQLGFSELMRKPPQ